MQIRTCGLPDLLRLLEIENRGVEQYYDAGFSREMLKPRTEEDFCFLLANTSCVGAFAVSGELTGYMLYYPIGPYLHLEEHVVHPDFQRQGVGSELLHHYLRAGQQLTQCKYYSLLVLSEAYWAVGCYKKAGFGEATLRILDSLENDSFKHLVEAERRQNYAIRRILLLKTKE